MPCSSGVDAEPGAGGADAAGRGALPARTLMKLTRQDYPAHSLGGNAQTSRRFRLRAVTPEHYEPGP